GRGPLSEGLIRPYAVPRNPNAASRRVANQRPRGARRYDPGGPLPEQDPRQLAPVSLGQGIVRAKQLEDVERGIARLVGGAAPVATHHLEQLGERVRISPACGQRAAEAEAGVE